MKAAIIFIENSKGEVLVTTRRNSTTVGLVGGKVDDGETCVQAALREAREETGIALNESDLRYVFTEMSKDKDDKAFITTAYYARYDGEVTGGIEDGITCKWANPSELIDNSPFGEYNQKLMNHL